MALKHEGELTYSPGGAALNAMRAAKYILRTHFDCDSDIHFLGAVGDDNEGRMLRSACEDGGVQAVFQTIATENTGVCCSFVRSTDGERCLVTVPGAYKHFSAAPLLAAESKESQVVAAADLVYVTSFVLSNSNRAEAAKSMAQTAKKHGKKFALNLSSAGMLGLPAVMSRVHDMLPYCDMVFGNETEYQVLADVCDWKDGKLGTDRVNRCAMQHVLRRIKPSGCVVQTRGAGATVVLDGSNESIRLDYVPVVQVPQGLIKDSNGAGDCFVGGFLAGAVRGLSLVQCAELGNSCAGINIQHTGCIFPKHGGTIEDRSEGGCTVEGGCTTEEGGCTIDGGLYPFIQSR
jgi:adenosine kinase